MALITWLILISITRATAAGVEVLAPGDERGRVCAALLNPTRTFADLLPTLDDDDALGIVRALYPELFTWLSQKTDATAEGGGLAGCGDFGPARDQTPAARLFGFDHVEVNRTCVGFLALKWILAGEYERFVERQPAAVKLSRASFDELRAYAARVLARPGDVDAMIVAILTNDLGKVRRYHDLTERGVGRVLVDHDEVLFEGFSTWPEISPSFHRLALADKRKIIRGLEMGSRLNIGQFAQAENLPVDLTGAIAMRGQLDAFDFKFIELLLDVAGARGHVDARGALVMNEPVYQGFRTARAALLKVVDGGSPRDAYDEVLNERARRLGWPTLAPGALLERAILRLIVMSRATTAAEAGDVDRAVRALPANVRAILTAELNVDGIDDGWGVLPYYGPAFFVNAFGKLGPGRRADALRTTLLALARALHLGRVRLAQDRPPGHGRIVANLGDLAEYVKTDAFAADPKSLLDQEFVFDGTGESFFVKLREYPPLRPVLFPGVDTAAAAAGQNILLIGVGGGSDVVQAAQLAHALTAAGKTVRALVSFRTARRGSGDAGRGYVSVTAHGDDLFGIRADTTGPGGGRVLEPIVATDFPSYLALIDVNDVAPGIARRIIELVRTRHGQVDEIWLVDTGGDSLYPPPDGAAGPGVARATPDQDLAVLNAFARLDGAPTITSVVLAAGVDSPDDAEATLRRAYARYWAPNSAETKGILERYEAWDLTGGSEERYGKTPYAWQAALRGATGVAVVPLPSAPVLNRVNPWMPFTRVPATGAFLMRLEDHLAALARAK